MSRRHPISLLSTCAARWRISFSRSGAFDCACADGVQMAAVSVSVSESESESESESVKQRSDMLFSYGPALSQDSGTTCQLQSCASFGSPQPSEGEPGSHTPRTAVMEASGQ